MADERPEIDMKELLEQRKIQGKPLVIIEPETATPEVVEALRKMLPKDKQDAVVLVDLDKTNK